MTYRLHIRPKATRRWRTKLLLGVATLVLCTSSALSAAQALDGTPAPVTQPPLLITQVQTRGCASAATPCIEDDSKEFVQVYNPSSSSLQVSGWKLRYYNSTGTASELISFSGTFAPHTYSLFAHSGTYDDSADLHFAIGSTANKIYKTVGHVAIIDSSDNIVDLVGWGSGAGRALVAPASAPELGKLLSRKTGLTTGEFLHSGNNASDFMTTAAAQPEAGGFTLPVETPADPQPDTPTPSTLTCEGVIISELLPNPAGSDGGQEFIELHNPTNEAIGLDGCSLQSSASSAKSYVFNQTMMQPGEYRAFGDNLTGISLPNSTGGTVWLLSPTDELQAIIYPADMEDDTSWALGGEAWAATYSPTPGALNVTLPTKPCENPDQVRNPETGRCATPETIATGLISTASATGGPTPCKPGQERNPETNRCRAIAASASTATPCKEGQERNPETNRCRAVASGTTTKDCPAGQERNPETNRCRKILASGAGGNIADVKDIGADAASGGQGRPYWLIGLAAGILIIGYAVYEWRQEISRFIAQHAGRLPFAKRTGTALSVN